MICHPESKNSRTDKYHRMSDEIYLGVDEIDARDENLSTVSVAIYF